MPNYYARMSLMSAQEGRRIGRYMRKMWAFCFQKEVGGKLFAILKTHFYHILHLNNIWMYVFRFIQIFIGSLSLFSLSIAKNLYIYKSEARFQLHWIPFTRWDIWWNIWYLFFLIISKGIQNQNHWHWCCSSFGCRCVFHLMPYSIHFSLTPSTLWKWLIWIYECRRYAFASNWYLLNI